MKLRICDLADENPFPDQDLNIHWREQLGTYYLIDGYTRVGSVSNAMGCFMVTTYWETEHQLLFEELEEAKAYLVTIYRLESTT